MNDKTTNGTLKIPYSESFKLHVSCFKGKACTSKLSAMQKRNLADTLRIKSYTGVKQDPMCINRPKIEGFEY